MLWKPEPGTTVTFNQFLSAQATVVEITGDTWRPWRREERRDELEAAYGVFSQWHRAEPGFRMWTQDDITTWQRERRTQFAKERKQEKADRVARISLHDRDREHARLRLLEAEAHLQSSTLHRDGLIAKTVFPAMNSARRTDEIQQYDTSIAQLSVTVDQLRDTVGDPETVIDQRGYLPSQRRRSHLVGFSCWRQREFTRLRALTGELQAQYDASTDRVQRSELRSKLASENSTLTAVEAIPEPTPAQMCSECEKPLDWHDSPYTLVLPKGPCDAWPNYAEERRKTRAWFLELTKKKTVPAPPKPKPLAVIPSGLPIDEIMTKLAELQTQHPKAIVRRGNANKWELWPPKQ